MTGRAEKQPFELAPNLGLTALGRAFVGGARPEAGAFPPTDRLNGKVSASQPHTGRQAAAAREGVTG